MSWISDFAGRAEEFLNKIDNNAAAILKKDKNGTPARITVLDEVTSLNHAVEQEELQTRLNPSVKPNQLKMTRATHSSPSFNVKQDDEQLIEFLNDSAAVDIEQVEFSAPKPELLTNGVAMEETLDVTRKVEALTNENQMLKNEVRSLNSELTLLLSRTKNAERDVNLGQGRLSNVESELRRLEKELSVVNEKLSTSEAYGHKLYIENQRLTELTKNSEAQQDISLSAVSNAEKMLSEFKAEAQRKEATMKDDLTSLQTRLETSKRELLQLQTESNAELKDLKSRLSETQSELQSYRLKAQKTLSEKDRLIAELRKAGTSQEIEEVVSLELDQLRNEKVAAFEECEELRCKLDDARGQFRNSEKKLELLREESGLTIKMTEAKLAEETARRFAAEEHCNAHAEELHAVKEELSRQVSNLTLKVKEREAELSRLRNQLSRQKAVSPPPRSQIEERITSLTSALVQKQAALEQAAKERNLLRLELDQTKIKFRDYVSQVQGRAISVNDTDDAKLQVPSFLLESPFDTGVARRVKRAYSSLDAVSIRTGVFLRRYPLARIFVLCYVICLHLWVCLVLFSRTPETKL